MTKTLLQLYGLTWNPFAPDVPTEALGSPPTMPTASVAQRSWISHACSGGSSTTAWGCS